VWRGSGPFDTIRIEIPTHEKRAMSERPSTVRLSPAEPTHRRFVERLSAEVFRRYGGYDVTLPELMEQPWIRTTIAESRGEAVGFAMLSLEDAPRGEIDLVAIAVSPAWQARGVGSRLLEHAETEARRLAPGGRVAVRLTVAVDNQPALRLFTGAGYARRPGAGGRYPRGQRSINLFKRIA